MAAIQVAIGRNIWTIRSIDSDMISTRMLTRNFIKIQCIGRCSSSKSVAIRALKLQSAEGGVSNDSDRTGRSLARQRTNLVYTPVTTGRRWEEEPELSLAKRLAKAWSLFWKVLLPPPPIVLSSADCAKERLRLLLFYERGEMPKELEWKLRETIVHAISDYVEIRTEGDVGLNISADTSNGTVFSITVPVRRVKPQFQESGFKDRLQQVFGEDQERQERLYQALEDRLSVTEWRDEASPSREEE